MFNKRAIMVFFIGLLWLFSGCSPSVPTAELATCPDSLPSVIKIGVNETMTGWGAYYGDITWKGIRLAHKHNPDVLGKPVELVLVNNKSEAEMAARVAQRLVEQEQVHAVLGVNSSSMAIVQNEVLARVEIPSIGSACTNPQVTHDKPYAFCAAFTDYFQGEAAARYAIENLGAQTAALLVDTSLDYCVGLGDYFRDNFIELTGQEDSILGYFSFEIGEHDFTSHLTAIKALNPDIVFVPNEYVEVAVILQQAQQLGLTPGIKFLSGDACDVPQFLELVGGAANGFSHTTLFHPDAYTHPEAIAFIDGFREEYGLEPETFAVTGYDAYTILVDAIERAGSADPAAIRDALEQTDLVGARGQIRFDEQGNAIVPCVIVGFQDGKKVFLDLVEP